MAFPRFVPGQVRVIDALTAEVAVGPVPDGFGLGQEIAAPHTILHSIAVTMARQMQNTPSRSSQMQSIMAPPPQT